MKLWGGRFTKATDKSVEEFNASIQFDCRMYAEDICGSIAHATMLAKQGIISQEDKDAIVKGLKAIFQQIEDGDFDFSVELEDIHMNIEKHILTHVPKEYFPYRHVIYVECRYIERINSDNLLSQYLKRKA